VRGLSVTTLLMAAAMASVPQTMDDPLLRTTSGDLGPA
jgi:hypothetical protein